MKKIEVPFKEFDAYFYLFALLAISCFAGAGIGIGVILFGVTIPAALCSAAGSIIAGLIVGTISFNTIRKAK